MTVPLDDDKINELLKQAFLHEHSKTGNGKLAEFILAEEKDIAVSPSKEKQLLDRLSNGSSGGHFPYFTLILLGLFVIGTIVPLIWIQSLPSFLAKANARNLSTSDVSSFVAGQTEKTSGAQHSVSSRALTTEKSLFTYSDTIISTAREINNQINQTQPDTVSVNEKAQENVFVFTNEERASYLKLKDEMIRRLLKKHSDFYTHVDADKMEIKGEDKIIDPFTLRNMTITNLEYKIFLSDLLSDGNMRDYSQSFPASANWARMGYPTLGSEYFISARFSDFPVVNISLSNARLFCYWLENEVKEYQEKNKMKVKRLKVRIPSAQEWIYAAWSGNGKVPYDQSYNTIFDPSETYVTQTFVKRMMLVRKKSTTRDTLYSWLNLNQFGRSEGDIMASFRRSEKSFPYLPADTLYGDRMKAYSRFYHVSEFVLDYEASEKLWCTGSSWKSKQDYELMVSDLKKYGASPFVTFRFVVVNEDDPEYKNPFW